MAFKPIKDADGLLKSVFLAYFILILHIILIIGLGFLVVFFRGIIFYMPWIFLVLSAATVISGYLFYKRMKREGRTLQEMLSLPVFKDRSVEVSLLGGFASLKVGKPSSALGIENNNPKPVKQLENSGSVDIDELTELVRLLENKLITIEEYNKAKQKIFK